MLQLATLCKLTCPSSPPPVLQAAGALLSRATSFDSAHWGSPKPLTSLLGNNGHPLPGLLMAKQVGGGGLAAAAAAPAACLPEGPQLELQQGLQAVSATAAPPVHVHAHAVLPLSPSCPPVLCLAAELPCSSCPARCYCPSLSRPDSFQPQPPAFPDAGRQPGPGARRDGRGRVGGSTDALGCC